MDKSRYLKVFLSLLMAMLFLLDAISPTLVLAKTYAENNKDSIVSVSDGKKVKSLFDDTNTGSIEEKSAEGNKKIKTEKIEKFKELAKPDTVEKDNNLNKSADEIKNTEKDSKLVLTEKKNNADKISKHEKINIDKLENIQKDAKKENLKENSNKNLEKDNKFEELKKQQEKDLLEKKALEKKALEEKEKLNFLERNVEVQVKSEKGKSLANVKLRLANFGGDRIVEKFTDKNGFCKFDNLEVGEYSLEQTESPKGYKNAGYEIRIVVDENRISYKKIDYKRLEKNHVANLDDIKSYKHNLQDLTRNNYLEEDLNTSSNDINNIFYELDGENKDEKENNFLKKSFDFSTSLLNSNDKDDKPNEIIEKEKNISDKTNKKSYKTISLTFDLEEEAEEENYKFFESNENINFNAAANPYYERGVLKAIDWIVVFKGDKKNPLENNLKANFTLLKSSGLSRIDNLTLNGVDQKDFVVDANEEKDENIKFSITSFPENDKKEYVYKFRTSVEKKSNKYFLDVFGIYKNEKEALRLVVKEEKIKDKVFVDEHSVIEGSHEKDNKLSWKVYELLSNGVKRNFPLEERELSKNQELQGLKAVVYKLNDKGVFEKTFENDDLVNEYPLNKKLYKINKEDNALYAFYSYIAEVKNPEDKIFSLDKLTIEETIPNSSFYSYGDADYTGGISNDEGILTLIKKKGNLRFDSEIAYCLNKKRIMPYYDGDKLSYQGSDSEDILRSLLDVDNTSNRVEKLKKVFFFSNMLERKYDVSSADDRLSLFYATQEAVYDAIGENKNRGDSYIESLKNKYKSYENSLDYRTREKMRKNLEIISKAESYYKEINTFISTSNISYGFISSMVKIDMFKISNFWRKPGKRRQNVITVKVKEPVFLSKIDKLTGKNLSGAEFKIVDSNNKYIIVKSNGNDIPLNINKGRYTLKEIKTPNGYKKIDDIRFEINERVVTRNKKISQYKNESRVNYDTRTERIVKTIRLLDSNPLARVDNNSLTLSVANEKENPKNDFYLKKVDTNNEPLQGAVFTLLRDGRPVRINEKEIISTSGVDGVVEFINILKYLSDGRYEIKEVAAPDDYTILDASIFINVANKKIVSVEKTGRESNLINITYKNSKSIPERNHNADNEFVSRRNISGIEFNNR